MVPRIVFFVIAALVSRASAADFSFPYPDGLTYSPNMFLYFSQQASNASYVQAYSLGGTQFVLLLIDEECFAHVLGVDLVANEPAWETVLGFSLNPTASTCEYVPDLNTLQAPPIFDGVYLDSNNTVIFIFPRAISSGYSSGHHSVMNYTAINVTSGEILITGFMSDLSAGYTYASGPLVIYSEWACNQATQFAARYDVAVGVGGKEVWRVQRGNVTSGGCASYVTTFVPMALTVPTRLGDVYIGYTYGGGMGSLSGSLAVDGTVLWTYTFEWGFAGGQMAPNVYAFDGQIAIEVMLASSEDIEVVVMDATTGVFTNRCPTAKYEGFWLVSVGASYVVLANNSATAAPGTAPVMYFIYTQNCTQASWSPIDLSSVSSGTQPTDWLGQMMPPPSVIFNNDTLAVINWINNTFVLTLPPPNSKVMGAVLMAIGAPWSVEKFLLNPTGENSVACSNMNAPFVDVDGIIRLAAACSYPAQAAILTPLIPDTRLTWQGITAIVCLAVNALCVFCLFTTKYIGGGGRGGYNPLDGGHSGPPAIVVRPAAVFSVACFAICMGISWSVLRTAENQVALYGNAIQDPMGFYNQFLTPCPSANTSAFTPQAACFCQDTLNSSSQLAPFQGISCSPAISAPSCASIFAAECACDMAFFEYKCPCTLGIQVSNCSTCVPEPSSTINANVAAQLKACAGAYSQSTKLLVACLVLQFVYLLWLTIQGIYQLKTGEEKWDLPGTALAFVHTLVNMILWGVAMSKLGVLGSLTVNSYCTNKIMALLPGCHLSANYVNADLEHQALVALTAAALLALPKPSLSLMHCCSTSCLVFCRCCCRG